MAVATEKDVFCLSNLHFLSLLPNLEKWPSDTMKGEKPKVKLSSSQIDKTFLYQKILTDFRSSGNTQCRHSINLFLYKMMDEFTAVETQEEWTSYGISISTKGREITPQNLIQTDFDSHFKIATPSTNPPDRPQIFVLLAMLLARFQISCSVGSRFDKYRKNLRLNLMATLRSMGLWNQVLGDLIAPDTLVPSCILEGDYSTLVAAYDMFFAKFPDHPYAALRKCTISTYYKDCTALNRLGDFSRSLGLDLRKVVPLILAPQACRELNAFLRKKEEYDSVNSYLAYCRSMGIIIKSPFSTTANPNLFAYVTSFLATQGDARGYNAVAPTRINLENVMKAVVFLVDNIDLIRQHSVLKDEEKKAEAERLQSMRIADPTNDTPQVDAENQERAKMTDPTKRTQTMEILNQICTNIENEDRYIEACSKIYKKLSEHTALRDDSIGQKLKMYCRSISFGEK